jgi:hypothetical protein
MVAESLKKHLQLLTTFFNESYANVSWENILLVEYKSLVNGVSYHVSKNDLFSPESYSPRFDWLLEQGHSWLNLQAAGIFQNTLLVVLETPNDSNKRPGNMTAINLSGPYRQQDKNDWEITDLVRIVG